MNPKAIGENVRFWRKHKNMTQSELAKKAFVTQQNVSRMEKGEIVPTIETLKAIADALDVSMPMLYNDESKQRYFGIDITSRYMERMEHEDDEVKIVMQHALTGGNGKIEVILALSESEQEMYKTWLGDLKDPVRFWEFLDDGSLEAGLQTPSDYVWCKKN